MVSLRIKALTIMFAFAAMLLSGCGGLAKNNNIMKVATDTSNLSELVKVLGKDHVDAVTILPPDACPDHYDITAQDMKKFNKSQILLVQTFQEGSFTEKLKSAANNKDLQVVTVKAPGNWMVPPFRIQAALILFPILADTDIKNKLFYEQNAEQVIKDIGNTGAKVKQQFLTAGVRQIKVICSDQQKPFLDWAGFKVVGTYGHPEELTPQLLQSLIDVGKEKAVTLVVDNLQSGPTAGQSLAEELGASHVTLSNSPGGFANAPTWAQTIAENTSRLINALQKNE